MPLQASVFYKHTFIILQMDHILLNLFKIFHILVMILASFLNLQLHVLVLVQWWKYELENELMF